MISEALVELALRTLSCTQKELASRLGVSPTQITKWKKGEHMSLDMEKKLRDVAMIGELDPEFILWASSYEEAVKWQKLIYRLADMAHENAETGYITDPLQDEMDLLCSNVSNVLTSMGIKPPKSFPEELDVDEDEEFWDAVEKDNYANIIYKIFNALNNVYGFYAAYISDFIYDEELDLFETEAGNIEPCLVALAACKIEVDTKLALRYKEFKYNVINDYEKWLNIVKDKAFRAGVPLRVELLALVYDSGDDLGLEAESESLGLNSSRIHPDIYMNELLVGMRTIHQVLPAILKKLEIDKEFQLDPSAFHIG
ncbi:helix-turn-helix domain-containing protein [Photorhabdus antumapuensis]|uniref:helix-turn-helix domain-containing protein n=1 Tax=Photorhabdus antumapuensis TaxID=2862867 RepID=UPI001CEDBF2B|nr:helix-turn-helix transcriptional regulator [Photorhabdus antumapuensis]MCA6221440.1 helix-turn-helix domain-containing protein [Photorhabdus antumapuensis]